MFTLPSSLPDAPAGLRQMLLEAMAEIERLRQQIAGLQGNRFGPRSEQFDDETLEQALEDLEQSVAEQATGLEAVSADAQPVATAPEPAAPRREPAKCNRGALPPTLPRVEVTVDVADRTCPCCGGPLHRIGPRSGPMPRQAVSWLGDDRAEMLDYVPAHFRVQVVRRPRYGCRACEGAVVQAPAPERPIDGGMATEALLAHVLINKYSDHRVPRTHQQRWRCGAV